MSRLSLAAVFAPVLFVAGAGVLAQDPAADIQKALSQCREFLLEEYPADIPEAERLAQSLRSDGSWADVDYESKDRSSWPASDHVERALTLARASANKAVSEQQRQSLLKSVHAALAWWRQHDLKCPNWWHNRIGVPRKLCEIAILLGGENTPEELGYLEMCVTTRSKVGDSTAQNRVWLAGINLMYGLVRGDAQLVGDSASTIFAEAAVSYGKEGIQPDYSFHQHGAQMQFGNYGMSFALDQTRWWSVLRGTGWAMPAAGRQVLRRYILDGQNWVVWKGFMDISCCGRALAPGVQESRGARVAAAVSRMASLDPEKEADHKAFLRRNTSGGENDLIGCRHFWRSDYLVHRRRDLCVTLKMCSRRVKGSESLNGQNLSGYHLADGVTYFYRRGDEYKDIFPLWNWRMLPGVTCAQERGPMPRFGSYRLDSDFVGAVTDGTNACAALDYSRDGVSARKAWFFAGDRIACLGAGISAAENVKAAVATTVNQCLLRGSVRTSDGKAESEQGYGVQVYANLRCVEHDGLRYTFPSAQGVKLSVQKRTGNWSSVANTPAMPKEDVHGDVFTLSIEHGSRPSDGSYSYIVSPADEAAGPNVDILSNTPALQAVRFDGRIVGAVFYEAGRMEYAPGRSLQVDSPCIVLVNTSSGEPAVTVADPTQKLRSLSVEVDGKRREVNLPAEGEAGKSVSVE